MTDHKNPPHLYPVHSDQPFSALWPICPQRFIELEDGLVIESAYGEIAVTDDAEVTCLKDSRIKAKKTGEDPGRFCLQ